ncbi:PPE family protein [Mycobacterium palustre]|nr:PPE family protein [Mycobacterium palustre]
MDFAGLPPEVNSARMYAGPGPAPLAMAATAWSALAAELHSAATSYQGVLSALTSGPWVGPSSTMMTSAAEPFVSWMSATAAKAKQTASQMESAVAAYEAAFAATVPPPVIEVNRALLAALVATNVLGQNTPAIAATEAQYAEMWAQDAMAMYSYAGASAAATRLVPFEAPPQTTDPAGSSSQGSAVAQATAAAGESNAQSALSGVPNLLQGLSSGFTLDNNPLLDLLNSSPVQVFNSLSSLTVGSQLLSEGLNFDASGAMLTFAPPVAAAWNPLIAALTPPAASASTASSVSGGSGAGPTLVGSSSGVSAGVGEAASVGKLSVPASWPGASPAIRLAATALPVADLEGMPAHPLGGLYGGMPPLGGPVASVINAPRDGEGSRNGARAKVVAALDRESGLNTDLADRWVAQNRRAADDEAVSERDELNQLRRAVADMTKQRDALKRTAALLIQEANNK